MERLESKELFNIIMQENIRLIKEKAITATIAFIMFDNAELSTRISFNLHVNTAKNIGIDVVPTILAADTKEEEFFKIIDKLNEDERITGIMFLIPIPKHISVEKAINRISYKKEIEGLHPRNAQVIFPTYLEKSPVELLVPKAVQRLMSYHKIEYGNANISVVLDYDFLIENPIANLVGRFGTSSLLPYEGALRIVTTKTKNVEKYLNDADIIIVSSQKTEMIKGDWVKDDSILLDFVPTQVGKKFDEQLNREVPIMKGAVDVNSFENRDKVRFFPSIGGVGPIMIAILLQNAIKAADYYRK
ncbi:tetrahydrofolate dehydrogenase/cyclohydrolase catalytic domain-containing protein [Clostridium paraputrificum]|uniref:tetrahydrofolate dehydrogenase/cyclohydrolase catalytic domain-containing protein n=1 Tax=Clostridium paraputrificum TaxID=29363 RepID=UPI003D341020